MTIFDRLEEALKIAQAEQDLPDFLAARIAAIIENERNYRGREDEIADLVEKVTLYDTYGQTGYLGMGVGNGILEKTLERWF